jgi:hypothetical protein
MAVTTNDLALCYLRKHNFPVMTQDTLANVKPFGPIARNVIKIQGNSILRITTVSTASLKFHVVNDNPP